MGRLEMAIDKGAGHIPLREKPSPNNTRASRTKNLVSVSKVISMTAQTWSYWTWKFTDSHTMKTLISAMIRSTKIFRDCP